MSYKARELMFSVRNAVITFGREWDVFLIEISCLRLVTYLCHILPPRFKQVYDMFTPKIFFSIA